MDSIKRVKQIKKYRAVKLNYSYLHPLLQNNKTVKYTPWTTLIVVICLLVSQKESHPMKKLIFIT